MTISITINALDAKEAREKLRELLGEQGFVHTPGVTSPISEMDLRKSLGEPSTRVPLGSVSNFIGEQSSEPETVKGNVLPAFFSAAKEEKKTRGKAKKKEELLAPPPQVAATSAMNLSTEPTGENVRAWVEALVGNDGDNGQAGGLEAARTLLESFGVTRVRDIPENLYGDMIELCQEALAKMNQPAVEVEAV